MAAAIGRILHPNADPAYLAQAVPFYDYRIRDIAIGAFTALAEIPLMGLLHHAIVSLMESLKFDLSSPQDVVQLWSSLKSVQRSLLETLYKAALTAYIVLLGPILEEYLFRGRLQTWMRGLFENQDSFASITLRVVGNGVTFGLCHLSPFQGWANVPIFLITMVMGCIFAALREYTGGSTASSVAHIIHNGVAMISIVFV